MADSARNYTDAELKAMEDYLTGIYAQAEKDLQKKFEKYLADFARLEMQNQKKVDAGEMSQEEFDEWRKNKLLYGTHWTKLIKQVQNEMSQCNQTALDYVNGKVPQIFAVNYNQLAEVIDNSPVGGYTFELVNADTIKNLATGNEIILPPRKNMDIPKDQLWNAKLVNAQLMQGILQGESIPKMAARMANVCNSNLKAATRTARTMTTAAENSGRQSSINRATTDGIILIKEWLATNDERTRDSHVAVNHERVRCDASTEKTKLFSNGLAFPADWHGKPSEVYNCRCTLITKYAGVDSKLLKAAIKRQDQIEKAINQQSELEKHVEHISRMNSAIENANIDWTNAPDGLRQAIIASAQNAPKYIADIISNTMPNAEIIFERGSGLSYYDPNTHIIHMYTEDRQIENIIDTFWHEYGHYIDLCNSSGSGFENTYVYFKRGRLIEDINGNFVESEPTKHEIKTKGLTAIFEVNQGQYNTRYQQAVVDDVNAMLKRCGFDDKYIMKIGADEWSNQWLYHKDGTSYDVLNPDMELAKAFRKECKNITGDLSYAEWMNKNYDYPLEINYYDYFEMYTTPKTQKVKQREKYKGAKSDFDRLSLERAIAVDKFESEHDMEKLRSDFDKYVEKVAIRDSHMGLSTDTFDAGAYGAFLSEYFGNGGHSAKYYSAANQNINETIANVFSAEVTQNEYVINQMQALNPNVFKLLKDVFENG